MQARIKAITAKVGFNSWFLDAYASGMVFDSYRPERPMTQAQNASGSIESARWLSEVLKLPAGSEGGNGTTAQGILFAHGMQTPVFGWSDEDMRTNNASPFYLGGWHPNSQPPVLFRAVPVKGQYRAVYFNPATRLPLYQAVFHGSVITTHHWVFDSLRFRNVRAESELAQLLYDVPPLYHLSADTLKMRIPIMQRQDGFFGPLHRKLATEALIGLRWLSADRLLQETVFSDGTRLVANFSSGNREADGRAFPARSIMALAPDGTSNTYAVSVDEGATVLE